MAYCWFIVCLILSLSTILSKSADVYVSIDCGSSDSDPYKDENGISWLGDGRFVKTGEPRSVIPSNSISHVADTMRVFTTGKKNCYRIDTVAQGRVLVRASFYYGNYDGNSSPPTFALLFDGNNWAQVLTSNSEYYYHEVTYVMNSASISVCVAQTEPNQFPFITALEVRSLETFMYRHVHDSFPLFLRERSSFGTNTTIMFPGDPYDRIWSPGAFGKGSIPVSGDAIFSEQPSPNDIPPPAVLKNAIAATTRNGSIELLMEFPSYEIPVYINWYFSEVTRLGPGQNRSFRIFKDNESFSEPILPPYEDCEEWFVSEITVSNKTTFSLVPTNVSTLPPILNAMEVFGIGVELTDGTDRKDVKGLASLQESFSVLRSWSGDPCLPSSYSWEWIQCNNEATPRVTALLLSGYNLSGLLPDFSSMDALQTIDFRNNSLQGPIPDFLGMLSNLRILNLENNQLNGTIPASLSTKTGLVLTVAGNPDLCTSCLVLPNAPPPSNSSVKKKKKLLEFLFAAMIPFMIIL